MLILIAPQFLPSFCAYCDELNVVTRNSRAGSAMHRLVARGNALALTVLVACVLLTSVNIHQLRRMQADFMAIQVLKNASGRQCRSNTPSWNK